MRTLTPPFKKSLTLFVFIGLFLGCSSAFAETAATKEAHHAQSHHDWPGIYYGFTPCEDCEGIKTTLALNANNSYLLITQYAGVNKSTREFTEKGKFTWGNNSNIIILTPRKSSQTRHYLVGEDSLTQLDNNGNLISGANANRYVLHRTDVTKTALQHSGH